MNPLLPSPLRNFFVNSDIAFANAGDNIRIPIAGVILGATAGDLKRSKKQRYWVALNTILLPPFLTEAAILDGKTAVTNHFKVLSKCIAANGK